MKLKNIKRKFINQIIEKTSPILISKEFKSWLHIVEKLEWNQDQISGRIWNQIDKEISNENR